MAIPKFFEFMKPSLVFLGDKNNHSKQEIFNHLVHYYSLTDEETTEYLPSGRTLVYKARAGWGLTYLKKAGLIESPEKTVFKITEEGLRVLEDNPPIINTTYLKKYPLFVEFATPRRAGSTGGNEPTVTSDDISPQDALDEAFNTIQKALKDDILDAVMNQTPEFFEKLVVDLLVAMGYGGSRIENSEVTRYSGDEGIDGIIKEDRLGFDKIYLQAKRWEPERTVGRPEIQKFVGALTGQGASKGAFISTASFSKDAREYADKQHACKIVLIDGIRLAELMIEHNLGVTVESSYEIKRIDSDYFNE